MGKFEKYCLKPKFSVNGEDFEIDFKVRDRIELAAIYDKKDNQEKYKLMIDFCEKLILRSYPPPDCTCKELNLPEGKYCPACIEELKKIDAFLTLNMEKFISELMISTNLIKREDFNKAVEDEAKKAKPL
jgi:hypothetical protein